MTVSKSLKLILPRIPKNGSTSFTAWIAEQDKSLTYDDTIEHSCLNHYGNLVVEEYKEDIGDYDVVLVGRNPFKRQVSAFEYNIMLNRPLPLIGNIDSTFEEFYSTMEIKHLNTWSTEWDVGQEFLNQHHTFLREGHPAISISDIKFVKLENFVEEMTELGYNITELPVLNHHTSIESKKNQKGFLQESVNWPPTQGSNYIVKDWSFYYGKSEIVQKIQELYKYDFMFWGYDPNINPYTEEPW